MPVDHEDIWDSQFFTHSPLFEPLLPAAAAFAAFSEWPTLAEYQTVFQSFDMPVAPVAQAGKPQRFDDLYETRIYLKGELQTRLRNWHDFFNALVWMSFPKTKTTLNELHYISSQQRGEKTNRSPLENAIALFDECGAVVISRDEKYLQMIRDHQWKSLFVEHRSAFENDIQCYVFGHAMYEKALQPYIGMTTNTLLIQSEELLQAGIEPVDQYLAEYWKQGRIQSTTELKPLPLLGVPGWYADNENPEFYDNAEYFRPRR